MAPRPRLLNDLFDESILARNAAINIMRILLRQRDLQRGTLARFLRMRNQIVAKVQMPRHFGMIRFIRMHMMRPMRITAFDKNRLPRISFSPNAS